jgi:hypothetical protein
MGIEGVLFVFQQHRTSSVPFFREICQISSRLAIAHESVGSPSELSKEKTCIIASAPFCSRLAGRFVFLRMLM